MSAIFDRLNLGNFGLGLPALVGVGLGVRMYTGGTLAYAASGALLVAAWALMCIGRLLVRARWLRLGTLLIELWVVSATVVTGFITALVLYLTLHTWVPEWLGSVPDSDGMKKLSATLVGAITTFAALVWTKDIADAKGYFWPSTQFRAAVDGLFMSLGARQPKADTPISGEAYQAMVEDKVGKLSGWGLRARWRRVRIIRTFLNQPAQAGATTAT